jgi:hypothetical protein
MKANRIGRAVMIGVGHAHSRVAGAARAGIVVDRVRVEVLVQVVVRAMIATSVAQEVLVDSKTVAVPVVADPGRRVDVRKIAVTIIAIKGRARRRSSGNRWSKRRCCLSRRQP